ncbi:hypothetical protein [Streptosporangium amethystogenes]|uniref:hypothetical protein n=1 Tax=Streptosporangium amethystogenes TaxID=2002 RepID=UPI0031E304EE
MIVSSPEHRDTKTSRRNPGLGQRNNRTGKQHCQTYPVITLTTATPGMETFATEWAPTA